MKKHYLWILASIFFLSLFSVGLNAQEEEAFDQAAGDVIVFIVHGFPGVNIGEPLDLPVNIYINGTLKLSNVKYGQIKKIKITPGTATIAAYKVGYGPEGGYSPIISDEFSFQMYENASIVGYLHPDGEPRYVKFTNDFSPAGDPSKCRVIIHNTSEESKLGFWIYNDNSSPPYEYRPWMGSDILEPGDKNVYEVAKTTLVGNSALVWWLEIGVGWDKWHAVYDKPFKITAGKAILVYLIGSTDMKTFRMIKKLMPLK